MNPRRIFASRDKQREEIIRTALEHRSQVKVEEKDGKQVDCYQPILISVFHSFA
jgi:hypothetical protein